MKRLLTSISFFDHEIESLDELIVELEGARETLLDVDIASDEAYDGAAVPVIHALVELRRIRERLEWSAREATEGKR